jgi:predicted transcriptional regulator
MKNSIDRECQEELLTEEDWAAIREGREAIQRGDFISLEELENELDLLERNIEEVTHGS